MQPDMSQQVPCSCRSQSQASGASPETQFQVALVTQDRGRRKLPISTRYYSEEISTLHVDTHLLAATDGDFSPESTKTDLTFFLTNVKLQELEDSWFRGLTKITYQLFFSAQQYEASVSRLLYTITFIQNT